MAVVLIVDDDPDVRGMLAFILGGEGHTIREANDGQAALDALAAHAPDCMVLDLMMPRLDGFEVLEALRRSDAREAPKVVVLSCKTDERALTRCYELGADAYITKPADPDVLAAKITDLCGDR